MKISKKKFTTFKRELNKHKEIGNISENQFDKIIGAYEITNPNKLNLIFIIGAILIGLGMLTFIASNWSVINKISKFIIVVSSYSLSIFVSYYFRDKHKMLSRTFLYIASFIVGAGVFLLGQAFHLGGDFPSAFFLWWLGVLPLSLLFRSKLLFVFSNILAIIYINSLYISYSGINILYQNIQHFSLMFILSLLMLYTRIKQFNYSFTVFINNILILNLILLLLLYLEVTILWIFIIYFVIGLLMYYIKHNNFYKVFKLQGNIIYGFTGIILTIAELWEEELIVSESVAIAIAAIVTLLLFILFVYETQKEGILSVILVGILIIKVYFTTLFMFIDKSLSFLILGGLLISIGYWISRKRGVINE